VGRRASVSDSSAELLAGDKFHTRIYYIEINIIKYYLKEQMNSF